MHITRVDLCELSRHTYESFEYLARKRHIDYTFTVSESPIFGYTDADKVEKILFNLLSNAFKYTPEGKHIGVSLQTADNRLFITVHDEGQGIAPEKIGKIFNRFETLGNPGNILSSGIGLSLVQELIQILHGEIQVESTLGRGSSFRVTLPISASSYPGVRLSDIVTEERADLPREEDITGKREGGDESILIVEDNDELRHFIKYVLQDDYNIITASNGKEGLDKTLSDQPSLIISDIMMPVMDGIEFLNAVKQNNDISHTMFILLSAKTSVKDRIKGLEYGADDYITKPFSPSYLKARVHNLLQKRRGLKAWYLHQTDEKAHHQATSQLTRFDDAFIRDIIQEIENNIKEITKIENVTDRALTMILYLMRTQAFFDGNKRTAMMAGNQIMIQNGVGIISIPIEYQEKFRDMLIKFYETNNMKDIKAFLYQNCIDGIEFNKTKENNWEKKLVKSKDNEIEL